MAGVVINQARLLRAVPDLCRKNLDMFVASFNMWAVHFGIDTEARVAMYLAEVFHESGYLKATEENMNYSAKRLMQVWPKRFPTLELASVYAYNPERLANKVYAGRMGNGDEASGDGYRFIGRGYIGLTGRENYQRYKDSGWCVDDIMVHPELLASYPENQKSAMWFWKEHDLNRYADVWEIERCSKAINGGTVGMNDRKFLYRRFCKEFGVKCKI